MRQVLLDAAREVFATHGYAGTSTRQIAERADVSEALLFRHFGTKANLFERAVVDPFAQFINDYVDRWTDPTVASNADEPSRAFVEGFYRLLRKHRELVMALLAARAYGQEDNEGLVSGNSALDLALRRLEEFVPNELNLFGFTSVDSTVATRIVFGMVLSMAVLDDWLFPYTGRRPSQKRIMDEMVTFLLHGIAHRDDAG